MNPWKVFSWRQKCSSYCSKKTCLKCSIKVQEYCSKSLKNFRKKLSFWDLEKLCLEFHENDTETQSRNVHSNRLNFSSEGPAQSVLLKSRSIFVAVLENFSSGGPVIALRVLKKYNFKIYNNISIRFCLKFSSINFTKLWHCVPC